MSTNSSQNSHQFILQGYLLKHSVLNPTVSSNSSSSRLIRTSGQNGSLLQFRKKRWFLFNPEHGKLYYYRTKDDLFPLGELDIRQATFVLKNAQQIISNNNASGSDTFQFEIRNGKKILTLEANSTADGFHWLRTLQQYRQSYFNRLIQLDNQNSPTGQTFSPKNFPLTNNEHPNLEVIEIPNQSKFYCDTILDSSHSKKNFHTNNSSQTSSLINSKNSKRTKSLPPTKRQPMSVTTEASNQSFKTALDHSNVLPTRASKNRLFSSIFTSYRSRNSNNTIQEVGVSNLVNNQSFTEINEGQCKQCKILKENLIALNHDKLALDDEVKTNREVIKILQEQLRIFNSEQQRELNQEDGESSQQDMIRLKVKYNLLKNENDSLQSENQSLLNTKQILEEMLESRDRTLVSLTHEVYDLESKNSRMQTRAELEREFIEDEVPQKIKHRISQLEDTVTAFEQQNEFLNKEIIELNEIRNIFESKEKQSEAKLCEVEAKCMQIQSKLLSLLKEINQCILEEERNQEQEFHGKEKPLKKISFATNESVKQLVSRLLEESSLDIPLSWKPGNRPRVGWTSSHSNSHQSFDYDELGFYHTEGSLPKFNDVVLSFDKNEIVWRSKWDQFMSNHINHGQSIIGSVELKQMIRSGVPQDYRCKIWRSLINQLVKDPKLKFGFNYYESLLSSKPTFSLGSQNKILDPSAKQIELDLLRTLPNNRHFENLESDGISRLRRVLLAYSVHNKSVGYCQGLNRLAAVALLFMPEEDAFWCLVAIVEIIMPKDYYGRNLMGAHVDQYVLRDLISEKLPQLSQHMEQHHMEISLFAWFLTIFVDNVPVTVYLHIWDVFLHEGSKVLFRFALAILRMHENELLQFTDSASINQFLRTLDDRHFNLQRLFDIAFRELNPFSSRSIRQKRLHYRALVVEELKKIDEFRETLHKSDEVEENSTDETKVVSKNRKSLLFEENESD